MSPSEPGVRRHSASRPARGVKMGNNLSVAVRFTPGTFALLAGIARLRRVSFALIVREAVAEYLERRSGR